MHKRGRSVENAFGCCRPVALSQHRLAPVGCGKRGAVVSDLPSPRAARLRPPSWLDRRLLLGLLLVLTSVVVGARVLAGADTSVPVYAATRDLVAGTALADSDLRVARVRLLANGDRYVSAAGSKPAGYVLLRAVGRDELLPRLALTAAAAAVPVRLVALPVRRNHLPPGLGHGRAVDVYLSRGTGKEANAAPTLVLAGVPVDSVAERGSRLAAADETGVVLRVPVAAVPAVVAAAQAGTIDLVLLPIDARSAPSPAPSSP